MRSSEPTGNLCSKTDLSGSPAGLLNRADSDTVILRHDTAVTRFAHRLTLQLVEPVFYRKRGGTFSPVRLLPLSQREQLLHQLNLR
jgi:hypothetical protein